MNEISEQRVFNPYDEFYSTTDWKENHLYSRIYIKSMLRIVKKVFGISVRTVIDVGCGTGIYTYTFTNLGYKTLGVDYSDVAINKAKKKFPQCNFECQDATNLNLSQKFDLFFVKGFSFFNTTDFENARNILKAWSEKLSDEGIIIIQSRTDFSQQSPSNWYFHSESEIREMYSTSEYNIRLVFVYNKLQYLFLIPFLGGRIVQVVNWVSKKIIIMRLKKPVNYFVFLTKNDRSL